MTTELEELSSSYIDWAPASLAIRELSRINALKILNTQLRFFNSQKILDVGCGDGKWWAHLCPNDLKKIYGIDISSKEIEIAKNFINAQVLDVTSEGFVNDLDEKKFELIIGNCSLEHIYHLNKALFNINKVLEEKGTFILFVPTPYWAFKGKSIKFLEMISPRLSMGFSGLINGFFQHWHLYDYKIWISILENLGFTCLGAYGIGNKRSEFVFRLGLPSAFLSFLIKSLTGRYLNYYLSPLIPRPLKKIFCKKLSSTIESNLQEATQDDIFEYMIVCTK